jgi:putative solute:sodium symporter small subunit
MKKIDRAKADQYFKEKNRYMGMYLVIWLVSSFGVVLFAESLATITLNGFPFHYFMGAQGSIVIFIILLYVNAKVSDGIDKKYGIDESKNEQISYGKTLDH